jgi:nucleoside-diphosphate-sugar epimerase
VVDMKGNIADQPGQSGEARHILKGERVFLTGATSSLGGEIAALLAGAGADLAALVRDPAAAGGLGRRARLIPGDCLRPEDYRDELLASDRVIHTAGLRLAPPLIEALAGHRQLRRIVVIGSARVSYPDRLLSAREIEGKHELLASERKIISSRLPWTILRPTLIFSTGDRSLSKVRRSLARRSIFPLPGSGRAVKQPISARDLAVSVIDALVSPAARQKSYDLPGREITVREMFETIGRLMGRRVFLFTVPGRPLELLKTGCRAAGFTRGERALARFLRWGGEFTVSGADAAADFGHCPRSFAENIQEQLAAGVSEASPASDLEEG